MRVSGSFAAVLPPRASELPRSHHVGAPAAPLSLLGRILSAIRPAVVPAASAVLIGATLAGQVSTAHAARASEIGLRTGIAVARVEVETPKSGPAPETDKTIATSSDLRRNAEVILFEAQRKPENAGFRTIERDAFDANARPRQAEKAASAALSASGALEHATLERAEPNAQEMYGALDTKLVKDPCARLALRVLLTDGKLTSLDGSPCSRSSLERSLLEELSKLSEHKLSARIDATRLVADLVRECAVPSAINQKLKATCTVTAAESFLALEDSAEYVRVVGELAREPGTTTLRDGSEIVRAQGTEKDDRSGRSASARLFQAAMMELGNGDARYDNATDKNSSGRRGLYMSELASALEKFTGHTWSRQRVPENSTTEEAFELIRCSIETNGRLLGSLAWGTKDKGGQSHGYHMILFTGAKDGRVQFNNPWGTEESISIRDLIDRKTELLIPTNGR